MSVAQVPEGWSLGSLLDFFQLQRGHDLPVQDRNGGDVPVIASNGVVGFHNQSPMDGPGVVTGRSGTIGNVSFVEGAYWPLNTTLYVKDFKGSDPKFVFHFLQHFPLKDYQSGTGVPTLNRNDVHVVPVQFPPLDEQRRIAEVLRSVDEAIAAADEAQQATMNVFSNVRAELLKRARQEFEEIGVIHAIAKNRGQKITKLQTSDYLDEGTFPIIDQGASFICGYTDDADTLWPYDLPVIVFGDHTRILKFVDFPFAIGADGTQCINPVPGLDARYLYYALQSLDLRGEGYARHFKLLKEKTIPVPDLSEQVEIAAQLLALETSIAVAEQTTQRLLATKRSLMSDLLSGRVRVPA